MFQAAGDILGQIMSSGAASGLVQQLFSGAQGGDLSGILNAISGGVDVNAKDEQNGGMTPLQMAIMAGLVEVVKLLLSKGASVNEPNNDGKSALDIAQQGADDAQDDETKEKFQQMVQMLQEHAAQ